MLTRVGAPRALNTLHKNRLLLSFIFFSTCLKAKIIRGERAVILSAAKDLAWRVARRERFACLPPPPPGCAQGPPEPGKSRPQKIAAARSFAGGSG
jgi:hypothetical protein